MWFWPVLSAAIDDGRPDKKNNRRTHMLHEGYRPGDAPRDPSADTQNKTVGKIQGLSSGLTTTMPSSFLISFRREIMSPSRVVNVSRSGTVSLMVFV